MLTQSTVASKQIRICAKLTTSQAQTLRNRLVELFPALATLNGQRRLQMVNDARTSQFRIIPLCGATLPNCLTPVFVERMIATIQDEQNTATCGDPALTAWQRDGAPVSGATWNGDYADVDGHGEIRLAVASN